MLRNVATSEKTGIMSLDVHFHVKDKQMDKRTKKLREYFPESNDETKLAILARSQRLVIGKKPLQLIEYDVGDGESMYAVYSKENNTIYIRLINLEDFPFIIS
jgi:hypothetical protein